jgi:AcrR family transcriptional regulator
MSPPDSTRAEWILDEALSLAEAESWEALHLHRLADELGISLNEIRLCYPQKDDLVEAWFDRADAAALAVPAGNGFGELPVRERQQRIIAAWLEALQPHRRLTREMLAYKLEPGHLHLQLAGLTRISRTVQWFREAARQDSHGLRRILEETALTLVYVGTFARWLYDDSPDSRETRRFLSRALQCEDSCITTLFEPGKDAHVPQAGGTQPSRLE